MADNSFPGPAIVVYQPDPSDEPQFFGPFASGGEANDWARGMGWTGSDYYWESLANPSSVKPGDFGES